MPLLCDRRLLVAFHDFSTQSTPQLQQYKQFRSSNGTLLVLSLWVFFSLFKFAVSKRAGSVVTCVGAECTLFSPLFTSQLSPAEKKTQKRSHYCMMMGLYQSHDVSAQIYAWNTTKRRIMVVSRDGNSFLLSLSLFPVPFDVFVTSRIYLLYVSLQLSLQLCLGSTIETKPVRIYRRPNFCVCICLTGSFLEGTHGERNPAIYS